MCQDNCDFDGRINLNASDVKSIIKSYDPAFKYISRDRSYIKEFLFKEYTVRFFLGYRSGIIDFGYLIWKEGQNHNYYKGDLVILTEMINPTILGNLQFKRPIVSSMADYEKVLNKIFELLSSFQIKFEKSILQYLNL